jgi:hypothetical protein
MLDHDTDSYQKITHAFVDGHPTGGLTRDHILGNITLYWLTGTGASAARSYWEGGRADVLSLHMARRKMLTAEQRTLPGLLPARSVAHLRQAAVPAAGAITDHRAAACPMAARCRP